MFLSQSIPSPILHPVNISSHSISSSSFQYLVFQHQPTSIPGSPRTVNRLPLPFSPCLELIFCYNHRISSILYTTHSHHFIITHIASIGPLEQCCELVWPLIIIYLTHNLLIPTPPAVQTFPSRYFCNKNSVKPTLFVSLALAYKDPPVSKENNIESEKREKVKQKGAKKIQSLRNIGINQKNINSIWHPAYLENKSNKKGRRYTPSEI